MKIKHLSFISAAAAVCLLCGCSQDAVRTNDAQTSEADAVAVVADIATTQYFTEETVDAGDVEIILQAGIHAPSAMNGQP